MKLKSLPLPNAIPLINSFLSNLLLCISYIHLSLGAHSHCSSSDHNYSHLDYPQSFLMTSWHLLLAPQIIPQNTQREVFIHATLTSLFSLQVPAWSGPDHSPRYFLDIYLPTSLNFTFQLHWKFFHFLYTKQSFPSFSAAISYSSFRY